MAVNLQNNIGKCLECNAPMPKEVSEKAEKEAKEEEAKKKEAEKQKPRHQEIMDRQAMVSSTPAAEDRMEDETGEPEVELGQRF